jgi:hypothetical protein
MKIRAGFVSNSSSTSFLILAKEDLNRDDFFELMGIKKDSPIADLFDSFYDDLVSSISSKVDFKTVDKTLSAKDCMNFRRDRVTEHMLKKLKEAKSKELKAYYGWLDSDNNMIESFFCTDSFEIENDKMYFNGLECVW